jgi:glycosyltransferase involved in cell wall biosynthesis
MSKVSVIIPSRNELFLSKTVEDLLTKATGEIEIIAVLEGYWPDPPLKDDKRLIQLHKGKAMGMRAAINSAAEVATGEWLMKTDAHCMFEEGYDDVLQADCEDNWVVVPRRYSLDPEDWCRRPKHHIDYLKVECPNETNNYEINVKVWNEKNYDQELAKLLIDDVFTFQGSCWFMPKKYYHVLELMDEENYGSFRKEPQEITFKAWLSGGRVIRNKKTWYAHLHKGKTYGRGYNYNKSDYRKGDIYLLNWLTNSAWSKQTIPFKWLIDKFEMPGWENFKWEGLKIVNGAISYD